MTYNTIKFHKCFHTNEDGYDKFGPKALKDWIGNGVCDDSINKIECNFDAGDCCGPNVHTEYCHECQCLYNGTLFGKES